jgi:hypothetical protein
MHVGQELLAQHTDSTHESPAAQSFITAHPFPIPQAGQTGPPQSTSVSCPSWIPSWHCPASPPASAPPAPVLDDVLPLDDPLELADPLELDGAPLLDAPLELNDVLVPAEPPAPPGPHVCSSVQSEESW